MGAFFQIKTFFFLQESTKNCRSRTYMHDSTQKTIRWLQTPSSAFSCSECCFSLCVNMIYGSAGSICSLFGICTFIPIHGRGRLREVYKWHGLEDWFTVCCVWEREREREDEWESPSALWVMNSKMCFAEAIKKCLQLAEGSLSIIYLLTCWPAHSLTTCTHTHTNHVELTE